MNKPENVIAEHHNTDQYAVALDDALIRQYISCLETLDGRKTHRLKSFWHRDIVLQTPLYTARGVEDALADFTNYMAAIGVSRTKINACGADQDNPTVMLLKWEQKINMAGQSHILGGMSEITWHPQSKKIIHQQDFWNPDPVYSAVSKLYRFGRSRARKHL